MTLPDLDAILFPNDVPKTGPEIDRLYDLYKLMVSSSEALVARRQGVNTFFLTINGALLTAIGLVIQGKGDRHLSAAGVVVLTLTGTILAAAWRSLLISFGQLNRGKFVVINRLELLLPAAIYAAEWKALGEGQDPKIYRSFTSREVWVPQTLVGVYLVAALLSILVTADFWTP